MFHKLCVFSGMNSNLNVNLDMSSIKEPQSRLRKWTTVDSISVNTSLDQNSSKHGMSNPPVRSDIPLLPGPLCQGDHGYEFHWGLGWNASSLSGFPAVFWAGPGVVFGV